MTIQIDAYTMEGPFRNIESLRDESGVFVVFCRSCDRDFELFDVDHSATVRSSVRDHERKSCWKRTCYGTLYYAVYYCNEEQCKQIARELIEKHDLPCGDK